MATRVGINGFGRIGRLIVRAGINDDDIEFVAVNDITDASTLAHLLKYDSSHGTFDDVGVDGDTLVVKGRRIKVLSVRDPAELPWRDLGVKMVVEATGLFRKRDEVQKHVDAGASKVIISAPAKNPDMTLVMGVNHKDYDSSRHHIVSNASCTTNCLAPVVKVIADEFGVRRGVMTTIHAYTNDQRILDSPHKDLRRARAAATSMIPTTTGAAEAVGEVIPEMKGKLTGMAIRVPTPNVSVVDVVLETERQVTVESANDAFKNSANGELREVLAYTEEPLVSKDFNGNPNSSIVDGLSTLVVGDNMLKVLAWYDNEWGFSCRVIDLIKYMTSN
ncbi:MAG: type I glyceraldehyde-3-phosphate dehydrogenase [bacterium]